MASWRITVTLGLIASVLALPVVPGVGTPPSSSLTEVAVAGWRAGAGGWATARVADGDAVLLATDVEAHPRVEVRSRRGRDWTAWQPLTDPGDHGPDPDRVEARGVRAGVSSSAWIGGADEVEVRVPAGAPRPSSLTAVISRGGDGMAWRPPRGGEPGAADALSVWPPMVPRSAWDPNGECHPKDAPDYAPDVKRVYVHHTAIFPEYEPTESDDLVRAMCTFHVDGRGFDDLGYNFLIDRYGRIFQGREGGVLRPVVGAHAAGFNTATVGIALIGNFDQTPVPPAALDSLDRLITWLFEWHGIDPYAVTPHVSTGGSTTIHPAGERVMLPTIVGHRQTATNTSCPGELLFAHVNGADPASHRVAHRLRHKGVEVGPPSPPPEPTVAPEPDPAPEEPAATASPAVTRVIERVVAVVRTLTRGRLDDRLVPAISGS